MTEELLRYSSLVNMEFSPTNLPIPEIVLSVEPPDMSEHHTFRRYSSPRISPTPPETILESDEEENGDEPANLQSSRTAGAEPPQTLPVPGKTENNSRLPELSSPRFLCVDESKRPRAHSDPFVAVSGFAGYALPEITVTEDDDADDEVDAATRAGGAARRGAPHPLMLLKEPIDAGRRRANTCPEDMFRPARKGRPATPPPTDVKSGVLGNKRRDRIQSANGPRRFSFNVAPPPCVIKSPTSVSFAHHKLSKVTEDSAPESPPLPPDPSRIADNTKTATQHGSQPHRDIQQVGSVCNSRQSADRSSPVSSLQLNDSKHIHAQGAISLPQSDTTSPPPCSRLQPSVDQVDAKQRLLYSGCKSSSINGPTSTQIHSSHAESFSNSFRSLSLADKA